MNIVTLGYFVGRSDLKARRYIVNRTYWGNQKCEFRYNIKALDKINLLTGTLPLIVSIALMVMTSNAKLIFLIIFIMAISRTFYRAELLNAKINCVKCGNIRFKGTHTGSSLLKLYFVNIAMLIFSLGLLTPRVINRTMAYFASHILIAGDLEKLYISSMPVHANATGEGVDEASGMLGGIDLDMGLI